MMPWPVTRYSSRPARKSSKPLTTAWASSSRIASTGQYFVVDRARARDRATIFGASALGCNVSSLLSCSLALAQLLLVLLDEKPLGGEHAVRVAMQERKKADDRFGP